MTQQKKSASPSKLQSFLGTSYRVLETLGIDRIPDDGTNPVYKALAGLSPFTEEELQEFVDAEEMTEEEAESCLKMAIEGAELADKLKPFVWSGRSARKGAILKAYVVCQTSALNMLDGAIGTKDLGTIRQRWYASKSPEAMGFKFAAQSLERYLIQSADVVLVDNENARRKARKIIQKSRNILDGCIEYKVNWKKSDRDQLERELGRKARIHILPKDGWGRAYAQQMSGIFVRLVNDGLTYEELWVEDVSRKVFHFSPLVPDFHGAFLLEKEGLLPHFKDFCKAAGIPMIVAMSGNNAFAVVEAILNNHFRDRNGNYTPTPENPLHLFTITDHDYAGHIPVQNGAVAQFERYLPGAVVLHRVGIKPEQVRATGRSIVQAGYEFEHDYNKAYAEWAKEEGVWIGDTCYGIEVEALVPSAYIEFLIDAIVDACGGDDELKRKLSRMAEPDWWQIQQALQNDIENRSRLYHLLKAVENWSSSKAYDLIEHEVSAWINNLIGNDYDDKAWRNQDAVQDGVREKVEEQRDSIKFSDFVQHVQDKAYDAWRPVGSQQANVAVISQFLSDFDTEEENGIGTIVNALDNDNQDLIDALKSVAQDLSPFDLEV